MTIEIHIHKEYLSNLAAAGPLTDEQRAHLAARQAQVRKYVNDQTLLPALKPEDTRWLARTFPVLAILAPVMSTSEEKIEFPGDPMCLYSALTYAVNQVVKTRKMDLAPDAPYNDLCPQWGYLPTREYRLSVDDNGIRRYDRVLLNTDQTVFDPRVWNDEVKQYFIQHVLETMRPHVVMISSVSPGHRYALDIARTVREHLPETIIILGGRHADETVHYDGIRDTLKLEPTSAITKISEGAVGPIIDFLVSGQGYYALDILLRAISLSMEIPSKTISVDAVIRTLSEYATLFNPVEGQSLISAFGSDGLHAWPILGPKLQLEDLPSPYSAFAIRARFPVFHTDGHVSRTAHFMVTNACPYHCMFCSEGSAVVGSFLTFGDAGIEKAIRRMLEYIHYGAEAAFFDDSIFWGGNAGRIANFCRIWIEIREMAAQNPDGVLHLFGYSIPSQNILKFSWGAQFTADTLASRNHPEEGLFILQTMNQANCTYIYMGIESMAAPVIERIHKNVNKKIPWETRVRTALGLARSAGIRVGSSVLFGLDGETPETIEETISKVEELVEEDLLFIASPNILTYHPNTEISHAHNMEGKLDYHSPNIDNRPPYVYFEEAFPAVVSRNLTEQEIWYIHQETGKRWGKKRNLTPMAPVQLPPD